jgi:hypothetical protein
VKRAALALAALSVATAAPAQQTSSQTQAEPRARIISQEKTSQPPRLSKADKRNVMASCLRQVQADNPNVTGKAIEAYCDQALQSYLTRR